MGRSMGRRAMLRAVAAGGAGLGMAAAGGTVAHAAAGTGGSTAWRDAELRIGILLYEGFTALDAIGPYEILARVPGAAVAMMAERTGPVRTDTGVVALTADRAIADVDHLDVLVVPGGGQRGTTATMENARVLRWIGRIHRQTRWTTSVCTGSLILGSAGLLQGLPATTHWASRPYLEQLGATPTAERFVEAGRIITAAGVSAGQDMALHLAARLAGEKVAQALQLAIEYDPQPPFDTGTPEKAGPELQELAGQLLEAAARKRRATPA